MQTSTTRLVKPLQLWLARIFALAIILASIGIGISSLPETLDQLKHQGWTGVFWTINSQGEAIVQGLSPSAEGKGVAIGDKILNPNNEIGELGTTLTFQVQSGSALEREVTFVRDFPTSWEVYGGIQLGLPFDLSVTLHFLRIIISLMIGTLGALILYLLRSNDWMALLTATSLVSLAVTSFAPPSTNLTTIIFINLLTFLGILWLVLFPNGGQRLDRLQRRARREVQLRRQHVARPHRRRDQRPGRVHAAEDPR